jgi:chaperonin GroES
VLKEDFMIKPLNDNVLLKKEVTENKTASGIILSTNESKEENFGLVVAVGDGKIVDGKKIAMTVKVNDRVIFDKYATTEIKYKDEEYLLIPEGKILAVIE